MEMDIDLELETKISRRELRLLLLHEFRLGRKATEATSNICSTMGKDVLSIHTVRHWFHFLLDVYLLCLFCSIIIILIVSQVSQVIQSDLKIRQEEIGPDVGFHQKSPDS